MIQNKAKTGAAVAGVELSRRNFLTAAGVGALGVAGLGLFGCAPTSAASAGVDSEERGESGSAQPDETLDVQVCVIGAGPTGVTAAIQAAEMGADVLVIDIGSKAMNCNGHSIAACGSGWQQALGTYETPEEFVDFLAHYEDNPELDRDLMLFMAEDSPSALEWLAAHGVEFAGVTSAGPEPFEPPRTVVTKFGRDSQQAFNAPLEKAAEDAGVRFMLETEAFSLIQDESGAVTGVEARGLDGHSVTVRAQSTVLATGGFGGDAELLRAYAAGIPNEGVLEGPGLWTRGTGFSIRSGLSVGAEVCSYGGGGVMYKNMEGANPDHAGMALHVGPDGRRFCNESINRLDRATMALDNRYSAVYIVSDSELLANLYTGASSSGGSATAASDGGVNDALKAALEANTAFEADTIEDLARKIGMNGAALRQTVDTYNGYCRAGVDDEFGKPVERTGLVADPDRANENDIDQIEQQITLLNEIKTPPFYATKVFMSTFQLSHTHGGLKISKNGEVLDTNGVPIPNLYSGGEAANGSVLGRAYVTSGTSLMACYCFGRYAGESAARNAGI